MVARIAARQRGGPAALGARIHGLGDLGLGADVLTDRAAELASVAAEAFAAAAEDPAVAALGSELPTRLLELVGDRARRCLQQLP